MNSLGPLLPRVSCLSTRSIFQACSKADSLAARLARQCERTYLIPAFRCSRVPRESIPMRPSLHLPKAGSTFRIRIRTYGSKRIITKFEDLPADYDASEGLPFRERRLSQEEAEKIFGKGIEVGMAIHVLKLLHGMRVAGTLEDPETAHNMPYEQRLIQLGLKWLRKHVPTDEISNAGLRAEQELREMEMEVLADSQRIGIYKPNSGGIWDDKSYGKGVFQKVREAKEKEYEEELAREKRKSQADEIRENAGTLTTTSRPESRRSNVVLRKSTTQIEEEKWKYYLEKRDEEFPSTPPEMSAFSRLWPSTLLVLGVLAACYVFTEVYQPPKNSARLWPDMPPSAATIIGLIIANTVIFAAWRVPPLLPFLSKYFVVLPGYPFAFGVLGSVFSHQGASHLAMNMMMLWFVGTRLHDEIGRANFLAIYIAAGVFGSYVSLASFVARNVFISSSLGASGSICGVIACYLCANAGEKVTLFGIFPPPDWPSITAMALLGFLMASDVFGVVLHKRRMARSEKLRNIDHWAHLGGYAAGIASAGLLRGRYRRRKEFERDRRKRVADRANAPEGTV